MKTISIEEAFKQAGGPITVSKCRCGDPACDSWKLDPVTQAGFIHGKVPAYLLAFSFNHFLEMRKLLERVNTQAFEDPRDIRALRLLWRDIGAKLEETENLEIPE